MQKRPINQECLYCAQNIDTKEAKNKDCHSYKCRRKRWYYKDLERGRAVQRKSHRYKKYQSDNCGLCGGKENLQCHHTTPQSIGGKDTKQDVMTVCESCHLIITRYECFLGLIHSNSRKSLSK